jgi:hypothetical protein
MKTDSGVAPLRITTDQIGPSRTTERQRTLRSTIAWRFELLSGEEKTLFARLGIFVGGCRIDAVETVCDAAGKGFLADSSTNTTPPEFANATGSMQLLQIRARTDAEASCLMPVVQLVCGRIWLEQDLLAYQANYYRTRESRPRRWRGDDPRE